MCVRNGWDSQADLKETWRREGPAHPHNLTLVAGSSFKAFFSTSIASLYSPMSDRSWKRLENLQYEPCWRTHKSKTRQRTDSNNVAAIYSSKIIKSNPILNKFPLLPGTLPAIIMYELIRIKLDDSSQLQWCCLSVIMQQDGPSPFPSCKGPWHCLARGSGRHGWCAAPHCTAPVWAERRPGCSNTSPGIPAPPPPLPSHCHWYHLYRDRATQPLMFALLWT